MVQQLTEQLSFSNEIVTKLKRENGQLETQLLKSEYDNAQLRNSNVVAEMRNQGSYGLGSERKNLSNASYSHSNKASRIGDREKSQVDVSISEELRNHDRETTSKKLNANSEYNERERVNSRIM